MLTTITNVIRWTLVGALLAVLILPAAWLWISQQQLTQITGTSMTPTYALDDLVLEGSPRTSDFRVGSVVTVSAGAGQFYTHRIQSITGKRAELKGDGNKFVDPGTIGYSDIVAVVRGHIGGVGATAARILQSWPARISILAIVIGLTLIPIAFHRRGRARYSRLGATPVSRDRFFADGADALPIGAPLHGRRSARSSLAVASKD
jgi:hypothetical protein